LECHNIQVDEIRLQVVSTLFLDGCGFEIGEQLHVLQDMQNKKCDNGDYELRKMLIMNYIIIYIHLELCNCGRKMHIDICKVCRGRHSFNELCPM
jgi:hypothetical protein